MYIANDMIL